jgi:hypothetical protein
MISIRRFFNGSSFHFSIRISINFMNKTHKIYAKASSQKKRQAIEANASAIISEEEPVWVGNDNLLDWLRKL